LRDLKISWREDPSNQNTDYRRAFLRHRVLPLLHTLTPDTTRRIAATTHRLNQAELALQWSLDQQWPGLDIQESAQGLSLDRYHLLGLPDELLARTLRRCHHTVTELPHPPGEKAVMGFIRLARSKPRRGEMRIRGMQIFKEDKRLIFCRSTQAAHVSFS
jgi:hypothetical protein